MIGVSVILPVYNVEDYIRECLLSIVNQTFKNIEIIIINDGSTDNSINKIKDIITINSNIILIEKVNGGLSSARNEGLKIARGEYISFIDSDDYVEPTFLENLYYEAKKYDLDVACGNFKKLYNDGSFKKITRKHELFTNEVLTGVDYLKKQLNLNDYKMEVWDDLYKREFINEFEIKFRIDLLHEDEDFTPRVLLNARKVKLVNDYGYIYRRRENSIATSKPNIKHINSIKHITDSFMELFNETNNSEQKQVLSKLVFLMTDIYKYKILKSNNIKNIKLLKDFNISKAIKIIRYDKNLSLKQIVLYKLWESNYLFYYLIIKVKNYRY